VAASATHPLCQSCLRAGPSGTRGDPHFCIRRGPFLSGPEVPVPEQDQPLSLLEHVSLVCEQPS